MSNNPTKLVSEFKLKLLKFTAFFVIFYLIILVFPGLTSNPVDWALELWQGAEFVDGWTPGLTVYGTLLVVLPAIYIIAVTILFVISRRRKQ